MVKKLLTVGTVLVLLAASAYAQSLPGYYPDDGFQRTGTLDGIDHQRQLIVIGDVQFRMASNMVVHGLSSYSIPKERLKIGQKLGYKLSPNGRLIMTLWVLPKNYEDRRR